LLISTSTGWRLASTRAQLNNAEVNSAKHAIRMRRRMQDSSQSHRRFTLEAGFAPLRLLAQLRVPIWQL
jgi:hypothetical protein